MLHKRPADESPRSTHQFHRVNEETARIDTQSYRVVDERERDERQQHSQHQQQDVQLCEVTVHAVHQVHLISHVCHLRILPEFLTDPHQRVGIGVVGVQLQLKRSRERVHAEELRRIGAHRLCLFLQGLFTTDVVDVLRERAMDQVLLELLGIAHADLVVKHDRHRQILLDPLRQVARCLHREHHQTQQHKHHRCTDT